MKKILITDLDDTLYDWIGFFIPAFYAMVDELHNITGIEKDILLSEYKIKHQYYGSVEYPYVTLELPSIIKKYNDSSLDEIKGFLSEAFHCFNSVRKNNLKLFDGVEDTLKALSEKGVVIIGYTESSQENGYYRLKKLGICDYFKRIYTLKSQYKSQYPVDERIITVNNKKPDKDILLSICKKEYFTPNEALYIGDSLTKDIYMANEAGITSVLMSHPKENNDYYKLLVDISSWTEDDFEHEAKLKEECTLHNVKPDYIISDFRKIKNIIFSV